MDKLADQLIDEFKEAGRTYNMPSEITVGSFCSGSEGFHTACLAIERAMAPSSLNGRVEGKASPKIRQVWMSEINDKKREWEMLVNADQDCCCFGDVRGLGTSLVS